MKRIVMAVATLTLLAAVPAQAQTGLFVGAQITGASLSYKDAAQDLDFGSGYGVHAGLMLGSSLGVLVNYDKNTLGSPLGGDPKATNAWRVFEMSCSAQTLAPDCAA